MTIIYAEEIGDRCKVPVLITDYGNSILIELRSYSLDGQNRGAIWQTLTWDQARILRDRLSEWLVENPRRSEE